MRKLNSNRGVLLDKVPERRTRRCAPRFRPGDHFCEKKSIKTIYVMLMKVFDDLIYIPKEIDYHKLP